MKRLILCIAPSAALLAVGCSGEGPVPESTARPASTSIPPVAQVAPLDPGLKVGEAAPKFSLKDQNGEARSLDELLKKRKVAVVFIRSIESSPHCRQHLVDLRDGMKKIEPARVQVVAISPDPVDVLKKFADPNMIGFPLLSDPEGTVRKAFNLDDPNDPGAPRPGTILVDQSGVIRDKSFLRDIQNRQTADELVDAAKKTG